MQANRNIIIVIAAFLLSSLCASADDETYGKVHYNIPTPNASEHMRFGNIPVNYHTGSPSISIPLYNFDCEGVKLDISLLTDIVYPTGGSTHFEYEQNTCSKYIIQRSGVYHVRAGEDFSAAGLRIKNISNFEGDSTNSALLSKQMFDYTSGGRSTGDMYMFTSMDPLCEKYYHISPYVYCGGNPVNRVDPDGRFIMTMDPNDHTKRYIYDVEQRCFVGDDGASYNGDNSFICSLTNALNSLCEGEAGLDLVSKLSASSLGVEIIKGRNNIESSWDGSRFQGVVSGISYNPKGFMQGGTPFTSLGHELAHSWDRIDGSINENTWYSETTVDGSKQQIKQAEKYATFVENRIRAEHGIGLRQSYSIDENGNPASGWVLDSNNRSLFYDKNGCHRPDYKKIKMKHERFVF